MQQIHGQVRDLGGDILVVSFAPPELVALFEKENKYPFPVVSDPDRSGYQAFGLRRASVPSLFRPGVVFRFVRLILRGFLPKKPAAKTDILQLGGDFVLNPEGVVTYAHPSAEPTDRPSKEELVDALTRSRA